MIASMYDILLLVSLVLLIIYVFMWHKHFDVHITLIFVLVPIANIGYSLMADTQTLESALIADKFTFVGGCALLPLIMLTVFDLCDIKLNRWIRSGVFLVSIVIFLSALSIGYTDVFYKDVWFERVDGAVVLHKEYGFMHTVFRGMIYVYFAAGLIAIIYSYFKKNQISRKIIFLLFLTEAIALGCFLFGRFFLPHIELLPFAYTFGLIVYLIIIYRICLYDVTDVAIDSLVQTGDTGFASFDFKYNYLGSNSTAKSVLPEFNDLTVDRPIGKDSPLRDSVQTWLEAFAQDEANDEAHFEKADRSYRVTITYLYNNKRKRGYQLFIVDDTDNQRYIELLNDFNDELQIEVDEKTAHIVEMHDKLVLGMASMVESRDNSTGGHIMRTSEGVRLLINEMILSDDDRLSDEFCHNVVKAAPMHDLGKIAVDDMILRKPGRFSEEEFEHMKSHAAEGARIVNNVLEGTDDEAFRHIAINVAHYHHERWDGSGYPEGLSGEDIPLEARIMAIADVYDALVSKRVYKEAIPFEKAHAIIMDGMGTQFDGQLECYYLSARPKLEAYYASLSEAE